MSDGRVGAVVLAGGRSSRFGRDKLAEPIDGRPMLDWAIEAVRAVASDVVVVVAPKAVRSVPTGAVRPGLAGTRIVHDTQAFEGPLAGLAVGLAALHPEVERVVVVGGDMPSLSPKVLWRLLDALDLGADVALLGHDGDARPLPAACRRASATTAVQALLAAGERRLRALPERLPSVIVPADAWTTDDPDGLTLRDVDVPADL